MKAMIFAAGLGTRLRPLTNEKPKALVEIGGVTLLENTIQKLIKFGFNEIIVNVYHFADQIINFLKEKNFDARICVSNEQEVLLNTGGGLKHAQWFFDDAKPFLAHNVDIITDLDLLEFYNTHMKNDAIATLAVQKRDSSRYLLFDENDNLCGWRDDKKGKVKFSRNTDIHKNYAFSGIQTIDPRIFRYFPWREVFSIIELYLDTAKNEKIKAFQHNETEWQDVGKIEDLRSQA